MIRDQLVLNLDIKSFERQCQLINDILIEKDLFLRVYEARKKFRYVIKKSHDKNEIKQDIFVCRATFNGFDIICHMFEKKKKKFAQSALFINQLRI